MAQANNKKDVTRIGLYGLAVMGRNVALNIASKGFKISVCNRSDSKVTDCIEQAKKDGLSDKVTAFYEEDIKNFVLSISKPRTIIILVQAGKPVQDVLKKFYELLEPNDLIIDGGNEWYENTEERIKEATKKNLLYMGCGISGGESGARYGPSLMPGGSKIGYERIKDILLAAAAKSNDGTVCCTYIGEGGAGNYVKMIHNGIEYGDMQLIAEAYDLLKNIGGLNNDEISQVFNEWNKSELDSYLIEITSNIFKKKDDRGPNQGKDYLVDKVLDKTGQKGTGLWTVKEGAQQCVALNTINAALNARYLSSLKEERIAASEEYKAPEIKVIPKSDRKQFINDVKNALYASKICSYAQGMNLIKKMGQSKNWNLNLGEIASIWKAGCIIRAKFLDRITSAYNNAKKNNKDLVSLLMDKGFAEDIKKSEKSWRNVVSLAVLNGIAVPAFSGSLAYYDTYRRLRLPANLTQSQRDYFGSHTYQRIDNIDDDGNEGNFIHSEWEQ